MEINIIPKFLDSALTPVAKETGERLADIVSLLFTPVIKAKAKRDKNIEIFLKELDSKVSNIPEEKLIEPPLNIVGPALDNVFKFYHDEEYLRHMYSTLIASAMHSENQVHPSYIDIIQQLSTQDANILNLFLIPLSLQKITKIRFLTTSILFAEIGVDCGTQYLNNNEIFGIMMFLSEDKKAFYTDQSIWQSFESLKRLGLIYFDKNKSSTELLEKYNINIEYNDNNSLLVNSVQIKLTNFGIKFANVCCDAPSDLDYLKNNRCVERINVMKDRFEF